MQWTTHYNLNCWFDTWKEILIELGFCRAKTNEDNLADCIGEVVFFPNQLERVINVDETDGGVDDTTGQRGGRPPITFHCADMAGGATAVNKTSYASTIISS